MSFRSRRGRGWESTVMNKRNNSGFSVPHPPGLRGRAIGLFYRNQHRKRIEEEGRDQSKDRQQKKKKLKTITLTLPPKFIHALTINLTTINKIAEEHKIKINVPDFETKIEKAMDSSLDSDATTSKSHLQSHQDKTKDQLDSDEKPMRDKLNLNEMKAKKQKIMDSIDEMEVSHNSPLQDSYDFKPKCEDEKDENRLLSLRGAGDYKYSYRDIITGTFEEKLDESLAKGITIQKVGDDSNKLNTIFYAEQQEVKSRSAYKKILKFREKLPAYRKSKEILDFVSNNQVVVISGETGCGKSTQVPQMILDDAIDKKQGSQVKILVTQPRRIAAISLATRVAEERTEAIGNSIGYVIRLERADCRPRGSILFCTTGVLLADLEVNQGLTDYSHIILDEVHERDSHIDLSMCMLKQVLKKRSDLKVILMSATLDAEKLSGYFCNCPSLHIEGLAYPVKDIYLEDILALTGFQLMEDKNKRSKNKPHFYGHRNTKSKRNEMAAEIQHRAEIGSWLESKKKDLDHHVYQTLLDPRIEVLNVDLIVEVLIYISKGDPGAVLVFLPGIGDITSLLRKMEESNKFPTSQFEVYPLHSKLPTLEQRRIFERPPNHIRKIIIATNIAETSITIDDIVYVVDSGRIKMSGLNVEQNLSTLSVQWVSQANLRQRRGRAGRCQPGVCYHLLTSFRASKLEERLLPEIQRSNLLEPVLSTKKLRLGKAEEAMNLMLEPPAQATVQWAVDHLRQSGALDVNETLTPLGWHLARLPVHPAAGKLLLFGALFGCLDRAASVAAVWGFKDPFQMVIGKEKQVDQMKRRLAMNEPSDHVAISQALLEWEACHSYTSKRNFAYDHFLSNNTLELLVQMKGQLGDNLKQMGFLPNGDVKSSWENRNADNMSLFKAIVAAALYPNIGSVKWPRKRNPNKPIIVSIPNQGYVKIHPSSVMSAQHGVPGVTISDSNANWLAYWLRQKTKEVYLLEVTLVYSLPLLFFGEMKITEAEESDECFWNVTDIRVRCKKETAKLLFQLRSLLDQVLASKVMSSSEHATRHSKFEEKVLNAVIEIITAQDDLADYSDDYSESDHSGYESSSRYSN